MDFSWESELELYMKQFFIILFLPPIKLLTFMDQLFDFFVQYKVTDYFLGHLYYQHKSLTVCNFFMKLENLLDIYKFEFSLSIKLFS
jgi:hypothetical protein